VDARVQETNTTVLQRQGMCTSEGAIQLDAINRRPGQYGTGASGSVQGFELTGSSGNT